METCCTINSRQVLAHQQVLVPARMILNRRDDLKTLLFVESRRLKGEGHQDNLRATTPSRLLLGRLEQLRAEAAMTPRCFHPELAHLTGPAPRVPTDAGDNATIAVADEEREPFAAADARDVRIELIDPIFQVLHVVWRRISGIQRDLTHFACLIPADDSVAGRPDSRRSVFCPPGPDVLAKRTTKPSCRDQGSGVPPGVRRAATTRRVRAGSIPRFPDRSREARRGGSR